MVGISVVMLIKAPFMHVISPAAAGGGKTSRFVIVLKYMRAFLSAGASRHALLHLKTAAGGGLYTPARNGSVLARRLPARSDTNTPSQFPVMS